MKINKKTLNYMMVAALLLFAVVIPFSVLAQDVTLSGIADSVDTAITAVAGSIVFIGWCITGILYLTAAGSPEKIGTAKKALIACVIGTVLVILAGASSDIMSVIKDAFGLG